MANTVKEVSFDYRGVRQTVNITFDEATGMPVVPEGYFWRVKTDSLGDVRVQLRHTRLFFGSFLTHSSYVEPRVNQETIAAAAGAIIGARKLRQQQRELCGDYPPKKLS